MRTWAWWALFALLAMLQALPFASAECAYRCMVVCDDVDDDPSSTCASRRALGQSDDIGYMTVEGRRDLLVEIADLKEAIDTFRTFVEEGFEDASAQIVAVRSQMADGFDTVVGRVQSFVEGGIDTIGSFTRSFYRTVNSTMDTIKAVVIGVLSAFLIIFFLYITDCLCIRRVAKRCMTGQQVQEDQSIREQLVHIIKQIDKMQERE